MSRKAKNLLFAFLVLSTLLAAATILGDWLPLLRGPAPETSEWYWPYLLRPLSRWWMPIIAGLILWLVASWWLYLEKSDRRRSLLALGLLFISSICLQLALIYADRSDIAAELVNRTLSNLASGFFEPAAEITDMGQVLSAYPQAMLQFASEHARTHPPGLIISNWLTIKTLSHFPTLSNLAAQVIWPLRCTDLWLLNRPPEVAAALGLWSVLPIIAAASTCFPAYALSRLLLRGRALRLAVVLATSIPALLLFAPKSVQFYPPLVLALFWSFLSGLSKKSTINMLSAGLLLSLLTFLSLGNGSLILLIVVYILFLFILFHSRMKNRQQMTDGWKSLIIPVCFFLLGTLSFWLVTWLFWGTSPLAIAQTGLQQHYELVTNIRRYEWWVVWNLVDLFIFSGWPVIVGFVGSLFLALQLWRVKKLGVVNILAFSLMILILILDFSGSARGETGRIWLFFIPLLAFPAAQFWHRFYPGRKPAITIIGLQLLLVISLGLAWRPVRAVIVVAEQPDMPASEPENNLAVDFKNQPFALGGFSLQPNPVQPGDMLALTLFWKAEGPAFRPYTVFNHLTDEAGNLVAQQDNWPVSGQWPPTCWRNGDTIVDSYTMPIPETLPPGQYQLTSGLYDAQTGDRIRMENGSDFIEIQTIQIKQN